MFSVNHFFFNNSKESFIKNLFYKILLIIIIIKFLKIKLIFRFKTNNSLLFFFKSYKLLYIIFSLLL